MKNKIFVVIFILLATTVFAQRMDTMLLNDVVNTSEGLYAVVMFYEGRNMGQEIANQQGRNPRATWIPSLSIGQSQAIRNVLNRYQNRVGDTYVITLVLNNSPNSRSNVAISVIVEMTSSTDYICWAYSLGLL